MVGKARDTKAANTPAKTTDKPAVGTMGTVQFPASRAESGTPETLIATEEIIERGNTKTKAAKVTHTDITHPFGTCVPFGECVCEAE